MAFNELASRSRPEDTDDTREVIHLDSLARRRNVVNTRWGMMLVFFMRLVAVLWLVLGLTYWNRILSPGAVPLDALPLDVSVTIAFFSVAHLAACVGLWLAAPWGGVLWLLAVGAELTAGWFMPSYFPSGIVVRASYFVLIFCYVAFTWMAAREREQF